jgi:hypothetical protein
LVLPFFTGSFVDFPACGRFLHRQDGHRPAMYIGIGTVVLILLIVVIVLLVRR